MDEDGAAIDSREPLPSPGELVRMYGQRAKKRFGQNFLTDPSVLDRIVAESGAAPGDRVVEVGPGPGGLTTRLLAHGCRVDAIEQDTDLVAHLNARLEGWPLNVISGDADSDLLNETLGQPPAALVANLPYNIATRILIRAVDANVPAAALMFQREVAERIVAAPGRNMSTLAVAVQVRYDAALTIRLAPGAFRPPPKVHSAVVTLRRKETPLVDAATEREVRRLCRAAYQKRRKQLRSGLGGVVSDSVALLEATGIAPTRRPEELTVSDWCALAKTSLSAKS